MGRHTDGPWAKPVVRTLADQIADTILEQIVRGQFRPGEALPSQRELARQLGVGLAVVREAIQRLQTLRILSTRQGRGTIIEPVGWTQLMFEPALGILALERHALEQIWEARSGIEKEVARLAAERANEADLAVIRQILEEAGDGLETFDENQRLNRDFHGAVAAASKNRVLSEMLEPLLAIDLGTHRKLYTIEISKQSWLSHRRIYEAIAARDQDAVAEAVADHAGKLEDELRQLAQLFEEEESALSRVSAASEN